VLIFREFCYVSKKEIGDEAIHCPSPLYCHDKSFYYPNGSCNVQWLRATPRETP